MSQNRSHAVMAQRHEAADSLDFFPTPAWGTRALCEHILSRGYLLHNCSAWEPACGLGHLARPNSRPRHTMPQQSKLGENLLSSISLRACDE